MDMPLRDHIAVEAMKVLLTKALDPRLPAGRWVRSDKLAVESYLIADDMLAAKFVTGKAEAVDEKI